MILNHPESITKINEYAVSNEPFLFIIDYKCRQPLIIPLRDINPEEILYQCGIHKNYKQELLVKSFQLNPQPPTYDNYKIAFDIVLSNIKQGNTFLTNLTLPSTLNTNTSLINIFHASKAPYKLYYKNKFVVFSPEIFVRIKKGIISSYPMKGTIDASVENAREQLLDNKKEQAEHATIVDLIRNDLSTVATDVKVKNYRYVDVIKTNNKPLLQVSSKISGNLPDDFKKQLGEIIFKMLPAGSITGAPKVKTMQIIEKAEGYERGYYTGVFGIFDGENLDSAVMIRFIEQQKDGLIYKSGGGITCFSNPDDEYNELIQKIYVPTG